MALSQPGAQMNLQSALFRAAVLRLLRLFYDICLSTMAFAVVILVPLLFVQGARVTSQALIHLYAYIACVVPFLLAARTHRMIWRFVSFRDMLRLASASAGAVVLFTAAETIWHFLNRSPGGSIPLGVAGWTLLLLTAVNTIFLAMPRIITRGMNDWRRRSFLPRRAGGVTECGDILITGDSDRIEAYLRETTRTARPPHKVVGVISDDARLHGGYIQGVQVYGGLQTLPTVMAHLEAQGVLPSALVLAMDDATRQDLEQLVSVGATVGLKVARLVPLGSLEDGGVVRELELADLLGRAEVRVDSAQTSHLVTGRVVLVTGGGGSIGSELCRQIAALGPRRLVVADNSEFNLYMIDKELSEKFPQIPHDVALIDVRDHALLREWFRRAGPEVVFHAAALKHVPLLEQLPGEAVKTNVFGTANVADCCQEFGVSTMVTVSTDKAVNPTNVMGATKRLAEAYCQGLDQFSPNVGGTRFVTVRFGNVLGSAGSVVPLFKRQIEAGGPVTVTHPDIVRYFMTIPEAVTLVLQAGANGSGNEGDRGSVYVLEMGAPVKIVDLARQMIRLSGYRPDIDIKISYIGLRPGEKLYEEIAYGDEKLEPTDLPSILKLRPRTTDFRIIGQQISELRLASERNDTERVLRILRTSVPEYAPWNSDGSLADDGVRSLRS